MKANTTFKGKHWDEQNYLEPPNGTKYAKVNTGNVFTGDLVGETTGAYLMLYRVDGTCSFVGLEHFAGRVGDREGTFTLQHVGEWTGGVVHAKWTIIPGSGTGALKGITGHAFFEAGHLPEYPVTLEYDFE